MRSGLEWSYRTPPIEPWWRLLVRSIAPVGEMLAIGLGMVAIYVLAILMVAL